MCRLQTEAKDMTVIVATASEQASYTEQRKRTMTDLADARVANEKELEEVVVFAGVHDEVVRESVARLKMRTKMRWTTTTTGGGWRGGR